MPAQPARPSLCRRGVPYLHSAVFAPNGVDSRANKLKRHHVWLFALLGTAQLIVGLKRHPEARGADARAFQPDGQIRADTRAASGRRNLRNLGITLLNRLSEHCGEEAGEMDRLDPFPDPCSLLRQEVTALRELGFSRQRGTALRTLAEEANGPKLAWLAQALH